MSDVKQFIEHGDLELGFGGNLMAWWSACEKREPDHTPPEAVDPLAAIGQAYDELRQQGWQEILYCPKDGSLFLAIEMGARRAFPCRYRGEWATGGWVVYHAGDAWPARPSLWRPLPPEQSE